VIEEHLDALTTPPGRTVLWMDYWVQARRSGRGEAVGGIDASSPARSRTRSGTPASLTPARARAIAQCVMGAALSHQSRPQSKADLREQIVAMSGGVERG